MKEKSVQISKFKFNDKMLNKASYCIYLLEILIDYVLEIA